MSGSSPPARFALVVSYRGTGYSGWQRQPLARSVQATLEEALGRLVGAPPRVVGSGRTDAGVHARGQVVHLDAPADLPCRALVLGCNGLLPDDVRVHWAGRMPAGFHARKQAAGKEYRYLLSAEPVIDALELPYRVPLPRDVDLDLVRRALPRLLGEHDFSAFASSGGAHRQARRTLYRAELTGRGPRFELRFAGSGFLRGMVRALVGTLFDVGRSRLSGAGLERLLSGGSRSDAGASVPGRGLVLERVWYPRSCIADDPYPAGEESRLLASWRRSRPRAPAPERGRTL
jgi:tRNA pseudouridine38-40 synthase